MSDQREATLTKVFEMPTHVLPEGAFYYAENVQQLPRLTASMNFAEVFIVAVRMPLFFRAYTIFFSKFGDGYMRNSMEYLKITGWRS